VTQPIGAFFMAGGAGAMNAAVNYHKSSADGSAAVTTILAGIVMGTICVGLNNATGTDIGTWLAAAILLASILTSGVEMMNMITDLVGL